MKCDHGYFCTVCGEQVETLEDSWLYLRFVLGEAEVRDLPSTKDRHVRCEPEYAQYVVDPEFAPVTDDRPETDKRRKPPEEAEAREKRVTRAWRHLRSVVGKGWPIEEYVLPEVRLAKLLGEE
ncbi:MAG: hypothetical protein HYZ53_06195 [Planctomycetes bacterium]|nr:hypothetical protein [Planctomycetota bacterium]